LQCLFAYISVLLHGYECAIKIFRRCAKRNGSKYLLELDKEKILIDCGLFQGQKELRLRNWQPLPIDPASIHSVIITHAHIDHIGYLPRLVKDGFRGKIICTHAAKT
jgi:metallo-beta-lactamase family protein